MKPNFYYGWDHPASAERYDAFCRAHLRYPHANRVLAKTLAPRPSDAILDVAAGTGNTAQVLLGCLAEAGRIACVEEAAAMRQRGQQCVTDPRVVWLSELPAAGLAFDAVACGAALWQVDDLGGLLRDLRRRLKADGRLVFTMPSLYLGIPDRPGGGRDPQLLELFSLLAQGRRVEGVAAPPLSLERLGKLLGATGFRASFESFEHRMTQGELRDWLRIPILTNALLGDLSLDERDEALARAFDQVDGASYKWEGWICCRAELADDADLGAAPR